MNYNLPTQILSYRADGTTYLLITYWDKTLSNFVNVKSFITTSSFVLDVSGSLSLLLFINDLDGRLL